MFDERVAVAKYGTAAERDPMIKRGKCSSPDKDLSKASFLFMVLGFGYLFPYHALAQPVDYWHLLFPTFDVDFEISWAYNIASVTTLFFIAWVGGKQWYTGRIVGGFVTQVLVLTILPVSYLVLTSERENLVMVLGCTVIVSVATSFLDSSVFSMANLFPPGAGIESVQLGMGFSMVVTSFYRMTTKAFFPANAIVEATMLYFLVGAVTVGCGIVAYFALLSLPLTRTSLTRATQDVVRLSLVRKIWRQELLVTITYASSLAAWPGVVSVIPSYQFPALNTSGWWSLYLLATYAVCELAGRYLVRFRCGVNAKTMYRLVLPRVLFVPLAMCCAKGVFSHDAVSIAVTVGAGVTSGYVGTLAIVVVNEIVDLEEQSATGMLSSLFLNVGLILGSSIGVVLATVFHM
ncbi:hypothetical protein DYB38_013517 [Aphanomyces astaci]|uniref:Major facilitator superfamily (MFS) profile domain-containing protein n=1 Tax=Aphanomyces astaci TaxID=112090 RepID=A0A397E3X3_APHAT|nr:hypothetical protein DYB38_013517 [Aphanomyces astaci]